MTFSFFRTIFFVIIVSVIAYGLWEARALIDGPSLSLSSPTQGAVSGNGFVTVSGDVARVSALAINGLPVLPDTNGYFTKTFVFPKGEDILHITVVDQFGRSVTKTRDIISQ